jgi:hypothetical protein
MSAALPCSQGIREREEDSDESASFASYNSYVEREMGGIINMVKVREGASTGADGTLLHLQQPSWGGCKAARSGQQPGALLC